MGKVQAGTAACSESQHNKGLGAATLISVDDSRHWTQRESMTSQWDWTPGPQGSILGRSDGDKLAEIDPVDKRLIMTHLFLDGGW